MRLAESLKMTVHWAILVDPFAAEILIVTRIQWLISDSELDALSPDGAYHTAHEYP